MLYNKEITHELIKHASPAKPGKRFLSFCIDYAIVLLVSFLLFSLGFTIVKTNNTYKKEVDIVEREVKYYNEFAEDTGLVELEDGERVNSIYLIIKNAYRAIYHSYLNSSIPDFNIPDSELNGSIINEDGTKTITVSSYGEASLDVDSISYFYTKYVVDHPELKIIDYNEKTPVQYLCELYDYYFDDDMFIIPSDKNSLPIMKPDTARKIYIFFFKEDASENNTKDYDAGKDLFYSFETSYQNMIDEAENLLVVSEPYFTDHYTVYRASYEKQGRFVNYTLIVSFILSYCISVLLPKLLFGDGRTIGRLVNKLGVNSMYEEKIPWYITLIHSVLGAIGFMSVMILIFLFPPFNGIYDFMYIPLLSSTRVFSLGMIMLLIGIASIAVYISTLFAYHKTSLLDVLTNTRVVDLKQLDEGENEQ